MTTISLAQPVIGPTWQKAEVQRRNDEGKLLQRCEWINVSSGERYRYDPLHVIAMKCAAIFLATPIYLGLYMAWHASRAVSTLFTQKISQWPKHLFNDIWCIVRAPIFAIGMMLAAPVGILQPLHGRKLVSEIERKWHFDASYKEDFRLLQDEKDLDILVYLKEALLDRSSTTTCYLAHCFQPLGTGSMIRN